MTGPIPASIRRFPASTLPWVVAACAVAVYSLTLNPWISFASASQVARVSGWLWEPNLTGPLYFLVTLPLRSLPETWIPAALNLFSALCAAAVLGLLARTVAILPHNRTHEQRVRCGSDGDILSLRSAWLPPALAVVVCGLQLTFWENATTGTQEMLDLLVFAYVIRCLLEFRLDGRDSWLLRSAAVTGLGMAGNYAMVGFFPLFVVALVWLKRLAFFDQRFLMRTALCGLAGLSLYLLLPLIQSQNADVPLGFWQSLKFTLAAQKTMIFGFPKKTLLLLGLTSLVPVLLISIRWPQSFGDLSPHGARFATLMFHVVHAAFLVVCIWIAFDPPVSPRNAGLGIPFLTFYYLAAIVVGYIAGYFLLVFGREAAAAAYTYGRSRRSPLNDFIVATVWVLAGVAAVGLVFRNLSNIRMTNSSMLRDYATLIADQIPQGPAVVLCDDPTREFVLRSALLQRGDRPDAILLNTGSLIWPQYHRMMADRHPDRWPMDPPTNMQARIHDRSLVNLMLRFTTNNQVCYAHPSFGYYFEVFDPQPAGILSLLTPFPKGVLLPDLLSPETVELNERFWDQDASRLLETVEAGLQLGRLSGPNDTRNPLVSKLHLEQEKNQSAQWLGTWLSRSLNSYAVELQRSGFVEPARQRFEQATRLNPENVAAGVNLKFNADLLEDRPSTVQITKSVEDEFGRYRGWEQVINANGLFDEPRFTLALAEVFLKGRLFRQSLREFDRVTQLLPDSLPPRLWCARLYSMLGRPDESLALVEQIRGEPKRFQLTPTNEVQLVLVEAVARLAAKEPDEAVGVIENAIAAAPDNLQLAGAALQLYLRANLYTNALHLVDRQIAVKPDDVNLLVNKGFVLLRMTNQVDAVEVLTRALELQSNSGPARLNRAIANLQLENLDAAQTDYETLLLQFPNAHPIYFGLGEIAFRRKDTNQAIYNFQLYLSNAPPNTLEARNVRQRLEDLAGGAP